MIFTNHNLPERRTFRLLLFRRIHFFWSPLFSVSGLLAWKTVQRSKGGSERANKITWPAPYGNRVRETGKHNTPRPQERGQEGPTFRAETRDLETRQPTGHRNCIQYQGLAYSSVRCADPLSIPFGGRFELGHSAQEKEMIRSLGSGVQGEDASGGDLDG